MEQRSGAGCLGWSDPNVFISGGALGGWKASLIQTISVVCEPLQVSGHDLFLVFPTPSTELTANEQSLNIRYLRVWCGGFLSQKDLAQDPGSLLVSWEISFKPQFPYLESSLTGFLRGDSEVLHWAGPMGHQSRACVLTALSLLKYAPLLWLLGVLMSLAPSKEPLVIFVINCVIERVSEALACTEEETRLVIRPEQP